MRQKRIAVLSTALMVLIVLFAIAWFAEYIRRAGPHVLTKDWSEYGFVDDDVVVSFSMRMWAALFYAPVIAVAFASFASALNLTNLYRRGLVFDQRAATALMWLGGSLVGVAVVDTLISASEGWFLTLWNVEGPLGWTYVYDPADLTIGLAGVGFWIIGLITRDAMLMAQENESFV